MGPAQTTEHGPARSPRTALPKGATSTFQEGERARDQAFARLECSLCRAPFLLDVEEHWSRQSPEMEVVGRKFLGVSPDAVLCPRCLHEVETAGAERIYWSLAGG